MKANFIGLSNKLEENALLNTTHQWYFTGQEVKLNNAERI